MMRALRTQSIAALPAPTISAESDPLVAAVNHYLFSGDSYDALPDLSKEEEQVAAHRLLAAPNDVLVNWREPAATREGAVAALRLALKEVEDGPEPELIVMSMLKASLGYFDSASTVHPHDPHVAWNRVDRLTRELSEALDECENGKHYAEVYPSKYTDRPVMIARCAPMIDNGRDRMEYHATQFQRAVKAVDPTATEWRLRYSVDDLDEERVSLIGSRKTSKSIEAA